MRCGRVYPAVETLSKEWNLGGRAAAAVMHLVTCGREPCGLRVELDVSKKTTCFGQGTTRVLNSREIKANEAPGSRNQVSVGGLGSVGVVGLRLGC
jgi:hypothetical protein